MKKFTYLAIAFAAVLMASCVSPPSLKAPGIKVSYYPQPAVMNGIFGNTQDENPYFEPTTIFLPKKHEFIVLRFDFSFEHDTSVDVIASALDERGLPVAELKTEDEMQVFWDGWQGIPNLNKQRSQILAQTYLPGFSFIAPKGYRSYYCILMGKNPLIRPAMIKIRIQAEGLPVQMYELPLPERNQKTPIDAVLQQN